MIPSGYNAELEVLFDIWAEYGLVPDKRLVRGYMLEQEFSDWLKSNLVGSAEMTLFGFRQFPVGVDYLNSVSICLNLIDSLHYQNLAKLALSSVELNCNSSVNEFFKQDVVSRGTIVLQWDWLIEQDASMLLTLERVIKNHSTLHNIIVAHIPVRAATQFAFNKQSMEGTSVFFPAWIKRVTSHMHMGTTRFQLSNDTYSLLFSGQRYEL